MCVYTETHTLNYNYNNRVCLCNIFNWRAKQLVEVICALTSEAKIVIYKVVMAAAYTAYCKHLESQAPTIHLDT